MRNLSLADSYTKCNTLPRVTGAVLLAKGLDQYEEDIRHDVPPVHPRGEEYARRAEKAEGFISLR